MHSLEARRVRPGRGRVTLNRPHPTAKPALELVSREMRGIDQAPVSNGVKRVTYSLRTLSGNSQQLIDSAERFFRVSISREDRSAFTRV
jgi:hypothetical protein